MAVNKNAKSGAENLKEKMKKAKGSASSAHLKAKEIHSKNMESLKEAHKISVDTVKNIADMHKGHMEKQRGYVEEVMGKVKGSHKAAQDFHMANLKKAQKDPKYGVEVMKKKMSEHLAHHKKIGENLHQSTKKIMDMMSERMKSSMNEVKSMMGL